MFLARDYVARRIGTIRKNLFSWNKEIAKFDRKYPAIEKFPVTEGVAHGLAVDGQTWWAHQGYGAKTMAVPPESNSQPHLTLYKSPILSQLRVIDIPGLDGTTVASLLSDEAK
jgi:hypothetical protein